LGNRAGGLARPAKRERPEQRWAQALKEATIRREVIEGMAHLEIMSGRAKSRFSAPEAPAITSLTT